MKNALKVLAICAVFASCSEAPKTPTVIQSAGDKMSAAADSMGAASKMVMD